MEGEVRNPGGAVDSGIPLLRAVFLRRLRLTRLLLEGGAYINESDSQGQTPLMVACRTQHCDPQSASRGKLVQFLLEKGADPNIQDKEGRSALMHACLEQAGAEVVSLLLDSGADISLEDRSGTSALVYAVMARELKVLKLLLDTCKAQGKEVIIIATDKLPYERLQAKQYISMPSLSLDQAAPASPSEVQLIASPIRPPRTVFSFKEAQPCGRKSHPCSPSRLQRPGEAAPLQQPLLRLNSEPWLKIPEALLAERLQAAVEDHEDLVQLHVGVASLDVSSCKCLTPQEDKSVKRLEGKGKEDGVKQKMSLPGSLSIHSASHPNLHSANMGADSSPSSSGGKHLSSPFHGMASSSLHSITQRRKVGSDIYSSDPQLAVDTQSVPHDSHQRPKDPAEGKRLPPLRCSSTLGSRESPPTSATGRRLLSGFERRGSGAYLLEQSSQARPRTLPPLPFSSSPTPVLGGFCAKEQGAKHAFPSAPPGHPKEPTRRMLLRRHSIQTEQFKSTA